MKQKIVRGHVLLAWLFKQSKPEKDIYAQLEETIAKRKKILAQWEKLFLPEEPKEKDIHEQLKETIAEFKKTRLKYQGIFSEQNKKAA